MNGNKQTPIEILERAIEDQKKLISLIIRERDEARGEIAEHRRHVAKLMQRLDAAIKERNEARWWARHFYELYRFAEH